MASIIPFMRKTGVIFDDGLTASLGQAFYHACKALHDRGQPQMVYEIIAMRIIDAAKNGERDVGRLGEAGLGALGLTKPDAAGSGTETKPLKDARPRSSG